MTLLIFYAVIAVGVSFLCSLLEAGILSLSRSYVESLAAKGSKSGRRLKAMKESIDRPLAAILTLNTVAHTVGAAGVGAQAAVVFGSAAVGIASAVMTLLVLVFSEIIPKTLGAIHAKPLAPFTAFTTQALIILCLPIVIPLEWLNKLIGRPGEGESVSRAELLATIRLGGTSGALADREYRVATNLISMASVKLGEVMTPRTVVFALDGSITVGDVMNEHHPVRFARVPIYDESIDKVIGYATRFALNNAMLANERGKPLSELAEPMIVLPEAGTVSDALEELIHKQQHIALLVDEYGGTAGIVTLEDLIETLLGTEIIDETDLVADMRELAKQRKN
ncbi:MAG: CNNM domain-containing protein [Planctomycetota bacterium]